MKSFLERWLEARELKPNKAAKVLTPVKLKIKRKVQQKIKQKIIKKREFRG